MDNIKRVLYPAMAVLTFALTVMLIDKTCKKYIEGYEAVESVDLIQMMDITGMSVLKGELLWPDSIIKEEYRNDHQEIFSALKGCYLYDDITIFQSNNINRFLVTPCNTAGHKLLSFDEVIPIYKSNLLFYLEYRVKMLFNLIGRTVSISLFSPAVGYCHKERSLNIDKLESNCPSILKLPFLYIVLSCVVTGFFVYRKIKKDKHIPYYILVLLGTLMISLVVIAIVCPSSQPRYVWPYVLLTMGSVMFSLAKEYKQ